MSSPLRISSSSPFDLILHLSPSLTGPQVLLRTFKYHRSRYFPSICFKIKVIYFLPSK
jgi:hypothetical protein